MHILHLDKNHPLIIEQFNEIGFTNDEDYTSSKEEVEAKAQKNYLGNGRVFWSNDAAIQKVAKAIDKQMPSDDEQDDLPF